MSPNRSYERGRRFEWQRKAHYQAEGYVVLRTAGSHGPFDLIAIKPGEPVLLIQCKVLKDGGEKQAYMLARKFKLDPPLPPCSSATPEYTQHIEVWAGEAKRLIEGAV